VGLWFMTAGGNNVGIEKYTNHIVFGGGGTFLGGKNENGAWTTTNLTPSQNSNFEERGCHHNFGKRVCQVVPTKREKRFLGGGELIVGKPPRKRTNSGVVRSKIAAPKKK